MSSETDTLNEGRLSLGDEADFRAFAARFLTSEVLSQVADKAECSHAEAEEQIRSFINEAFVGFSLLTRHLPRKTLGRVLEVGAGLRIVSMYLAHRGFQVTALEPVGRGFSFFDVAGEILWNANLGRRPDRIDDTANALKKDLHGEFDFIFSVHVLEHIDDLEGALNALESVLSETGKMAHLCPNYTIPYEPHFGILVFPWASEVSKKVFLKSGEFDEELWSSLNFVTAEQVKRLLTPLGLEVQFERGVMSHSIRRLNEDDVFAKRHDNLLLKLIAKASKTIRLERIVDVMPPQFSTPMEFTVTRLVGEGSRNRAQ